MLILCNRAFLRDLFKELEAGRIAERFFINALEVLFKFVRTEPATIAAQKFGFEGEHADEQDPDDFGNDAVDEEPGAERRQPQHRDVFVTQEIEHHAGHYGQAAQQGGRKALLRRMRPQPRAQLQPLANDCRQVLHDGDDVGSCLSLQDDTG